MNIDDLMLEIVDCMDPDEIVEVLDVDIAVLVDELRGLIWDNRERFYTHLEIDHESS